MQCSTIVVVFVRKEIAFDVKHNKRLILSLPQSHFERYCLERLDSLGKLNFITTIIKAEAALYLIESYSFLDSLKS